MSQRCVSCQVCSILNAGTVAWIRQLSPKMVADRIVFTLFEQLAFPKPLRVFWEKGITFRRGVDVGEEKFVAPRQGLSIELGAADEKEFLSGSDARDFFPLLDNVQGFVAWRVGEGSLVVRQHDDFPPRKRTTNGLVGFPAHDEGMAESCFFEKTQVFRQIPREFVCTADDFVVGHCSDGGQWTLGEWRHGGGLALSRGGGWGQLFQGRWLGRVGSQVKGGGDGDKTEQSKEQSFPTRHLAYTAYLDDFCVIAAGWILELCRLLIFLDGVCGWSLFYFHVGWFLFSERAGASGDFSLAL